MVLRICSWMSCVTLLAIAGLLCFDFYLFLTSTANYTKQ
jgi:hypothetical protein